MALKVIWERAHELGESKGLKFNGHFLIQVHYAIKSYKVCNFGYYVNNGKLVFLVFKFIIVILIFLKENVYFDF